MQSLHDFRCYILVFFDDAHLHLEQYFHEHGKVVFTLRVGQIRSQSELNQSFAQIKTLLAVVRIDAELVELAQCNR